MDELTFYNSIHTGAEIDKGVTGGINALRIDAAPQALTEAEKKRVRERLGIQGNSFEIAGYFATLAALQAAVTNPAPGAAYGVGGAPPYNIYVWDGVNEVWVNNGPISAEGISAYDYAVSGGYIGSETDFTQAMSQFPEHHTRHEAGGADEINISAAMLPTIPRSKLAADAFSVPTKLISTPNYSIPAAEGWTPYVTNANDTDFIFELTAAASAALPNGAEFTITWIYANSVQIKGTGVRFAIAGDVATRSNATAKISQKFGVAGIKKLFGNATTGDLWAVQGLVEVVL